jgi:putative hydrolase of the HAD superfamily
MQLARPEVLLLDAGNTVVFLDHDAVAAAVQQVCPLVTGAALRAAEPRAKRAYERELGIGLSHEEGWYLYMEVLLRTAGESDSRAKLAAKEARRAHDIFNLWRRVPGDLVSAIESARERGMRFGIVSNAEGTLASLFARLHLDHLFEHIVDSQLEGVRKPDPEIFRRALARMGVEASKALYAGDIPGVDVDGARSAGIEAVLIDPFDHFADYRAAPRFASVAQVLAAMET